MQERQVRNMERWFELLTALIGGGRPSAEELAKRFGVTVRTIYRDVANLEQMGVPVVRDGGRYAVLDTYRMRPIQFTAEEVLALASALNFGRRRRNLAGKAATGALDKLLAVMPAAHREMVAGLDETQVVEPLQGASVPGEPAVEQNLRAALQGCHPVRITHKGHASEAATERVLHPYGLTYRGTGLYLIGYCELRRGLRTFRVNRITAAVVLPAVFSRPADFDLEAFLADQWGIEDGPMMQVRVRFSKAVAGLARETVWHPTQTITEEPDGAVLVHMHTRGKNELARWLAGYGGTVEVLTPPDLREAVLNLGRAIMQRYAGG